MKDRVIQKLKENENRYVSGEMLSDMLGVSRTAVWKYISELKQEGYRVESSSRKGYKLVDSPDILNAYEISSRLDTAMIGRSVEYFSSLDSTNSYAKMLAAEGCADGTVVVADCQTAGRGRLGRT